MGAPIFNVNGPRPYLEDERGRIWYLDTEEGARQAAKYGVRMVDTSDWKPLSRTPRQDHVADQLIVDPRPIRSLNDQERAFMRDLVRRGAYIAVAGFETWRASDRWIYVDVLGVGVDSDDASKHGMAVGPLEAVDGFRVVGEQLALRILDPWGQATSQGRRR